MSDKPTLTQIKSGVRRASLEASAIRKFGLTSDTHEAGYILRSGKMLDFSGKRIGGSPGVRDLAHREVNNLSALNKLGYGGYGADRDHSSTAGMYKFMHETGAVRFYHIPAQTRSAPVLNADWVTHPTPAQVSRIQSAVARHGPTYVNFERTSETGEPMHLTKWDEPNIFSKENMLSHEVAPAIEGMR